MTYKEKKLKEFEEKLYGPDYFSHIDALDFLSSTIDEILACLPKHKEENEPIVVQGEHGKFFNHGFNCSILLFLQNLEQIKIKA